ncbi:hypothetical protein BP00DRAFT_238155 [Aspergillus indologenus CBS 114.80]|uniref:Uncharacterized protein n=1 Tax=Aspergillus indologenus CBS 114.80 TaxID=1450541 RepID=A0A2V5I5P0_9EURO|nr:hypothetical protein BP00DRAFT_238155 [Aspergillus indologenus CBS 114.80]
MRPLASETSPARLFPPRSRRVLCIGCLLPKGHDAFVLLIAVRLRLGGFRMLIGRPDVMIGFSRLYRWSWGALLLGVHVHFGMNSPTER